MYVSKETVVLRRSVGGGGDGYRAASVGGWLLKDDLALLTEFKM